MSDEAKQKADSSGAIVYQIRLRGHLGRQWADWFAGLAVTLEENSETLLTGPLADQAALHGVLRKVRDMGLPLLSVNPLPPDRPAGSDAADASGDERDGDGGRPRRPVDEDHGTNERPTR